MTGKLYEEAGVSLSAGYESVGLYRPHIERTQTEGVIDSIGGFGGLFDDAPYRRGMKRPILVASTDGVGTKLRLPQILSPLLPYDTVGIDLVAMCANDIVCMGARPLFFLDYLSVGKLYPKKAEQLMKGIAEDCVQAGCALIGGETAEHPGTTKKSDFDMAGFCVGIVDHDKILNPEGVQIGDKIIGIASSGVHSNGYSLLRKIFSKPSGKEKDLAKNLKSAGYKEQLHGHTLAEWLITPTLIYVDAVLDALRQTDVKSVAHITGGGFYENIPRMLPKHSSLTAYINVDSLPNRQATLFDLIRTEGEVPWKEMYEVFNMGTGMMLTVSPEHADEAVAIIESHEIFASVIGEIGVWGGQPVELYPAPSEEYNYYALY